MYSKAAYILVFILLMGFCQGYAQQSETAKPAQTSIAENSIYKKGKELQDKVFSKTDSLSGKSATLLENATDSLNNLSSAIEGKVQSKMDSLHQRLNEIQSKGNQQLSNVTEKANKLTRRIDSLQNLLSNKLQLDKLNKYGASVPGNDFADKLQIPESEKLSFPEMKGLAGIKTQILKQVQDDPRWCEFVARTIPLNDVDGINEISQRRQTAKIIFRRNCLHYDLYQLVVG